MSAQLSWLTSRSVVISEPSSGMTSPRLEQAAVEPVDLLGAEQAAVLGHLREQLAEGGREHARAALGGLREPLEDALRQEAGVLREEAEQDPVQEVGDVPRVVAAAAEALGDLGEVAGGPLGDLGRGDVGRKLLGQREDVAEACRASDGSSAARSSSVMVVSTGLRPVKLVWISIAGGR